VADEDDPRTVRVAFIRNLVNDDQKGVLFSIHDEDVPVFRCGCGRAARRADRRRQGSAFLKLFDADAEYPRHTEGIYVT
jgi:magnesium transporter